MFNGSGNNLNEKMSIYLVVGATSPTGVELVQTLLKEGKSVRILVRDLDKANACFANIWEKFEGVYECDLSESIYDSKLQKAFEVKEGSSIKLVISSLAATTKEDEKDMQMTNYKINIRLIDQCKKSNIEKFVFISSAHVTKPYTFMARLVNRIRPDALGLKNLVEIYILKSGLNYLIIRPAKLEEANKLHEINASQGDNEVGFITRRTLARVICDAIALNTNSDNVTFDVAARFPQMKKEYKNPFAGENPLLLKKDLKEDVLVYNHLGCLNLKKKMSIPLILISTGIALKFALFTFSKVFKVKKSPRIKV